MESIIKKAIEAGWKPRGVEIGGNNNGWTSIENVIGLVPKYEIVLDPLFWLSLGKACGWDNGGFYCKSGCGCKYPNGSGAHEYDCVWEKLEPNYGIALAFHEINLTQSWSEAIKYLEEITK